jgi:hypothetical protein
VVRVNYQREKRLKDLDRQRKQEEKRNRKLQKEQPPQPPEDGLVPASEVAPMPAPEGSDS